MPTYAPKAGDTTRSWYVIDATDVVLGRLAVAAATLLRGKHKPTFAPNVDGGDFVIVINASRLKFTGRKWETKSYDFYSHYPGGLKIVSAEQVRARHPERILETAVRRMVPRNRLGRKQMSKLKVYAGPQHPHQAQQPKALQLPK